MITGTIDYISAGLSSVRFQFGHLMINTHHDFQDLSQIISHSNVHMFPDQMYFTMLVALR